MSRLSALWCTCALAVFGCTAAPHTEQVPTWTVAHRIANGGLASVWGTGPTDVWAAGGRSGHGLVLHFDGRDWIPQDDQPPGFVWWIYGSGPNDVYAAGEKGLVRHFDGKSWSPVDSHTQATLYGLWVAPTGEVWAVGGNQIGRAHV